jgi:hypothetical protein
MAKSKIESRKFTATVSDIPNLTDALIEGVPEEPGWVFVAANGKGCECVISLFPSAHIEWRDPGPGWPHDWKGFSLHLPRVVADTETKLPLEITGGCDLDEARPAALAFPLAIGVKQQGGAPRCGKRNVETLCAAYRQLDTSALLRHSTYSALRHLHI